MNNLNEVAQDAKRPIDRLVIRDCSTCKHYSTAEDGYSCGRCGYPVPAWLLDVPGGGYVTPLQGEQCMVYESV